MLALFLVLLMAAMAGLGWGCRRASTRAGVEQAIAQRQRDSLRQLLADADQGRLMRFDDVLVVVDEKLVQELLSSVLPVERVIGRYRMRLTQASVRFEDGFALVRLGGRASLANRDEQHAYAELDLAGSIDVVELDPVSGRLRGRVTIIALDARRVDVLGLRAPGEAERLIEDLGREKLEAFGELVSALEIPVRVQRELQLPGVEAGAGLRIAPATVPLRAAIVDVEAFRGRLWISIDAATEGAATP